MSDASVYALFIDIMGFAAAIEALDDAEHDDLDEALRSPANWPQLRPRAINVAQSYTLFHNHLAKEISTFRLRLDTAMVFADSAYLIARDQRDIQAMAQSMMTFGYLCRIPLRAGIGSGNFARLVFSTASHPSGALIADSPFLGSAIVRAYRAERCPAKGFRIFVHPSVTIAEGSRSPFVDLPSEERSDHCQRELNFVHKPTGPGSSQDLLVSVSDMRLGVTNERALLHYDGSERAILRLHEAGEARGWE